MASNYTLKKILVDADALVYSAGFTADKDRETNEEHNEGIAKSILTNSINNLFQNLSSHFKQDFIPSSGVKSGFIKMYITANDQSNFRFKLAQTLPYKANRKDSKKPYYYDMFRTYLQDVYGAKLVSGYEADDAMAIEGQNTDSKNLMYLSEDKDLRQLPGWHYWYKSSDRYPKRPYYVNNRGFLHLEKSGGSLSVFATGEYQICYQMLVGDASDNIPGIKRGFGPMQAYEYLYNTCILDNDVPIIAVKRQYHAIYGAEAGEKRFQEIRSLVTLLTREPQIEN